MCGTRRGPRSEYRYEPLQPVQRSLPGERRARAVAPHSHWPLDRATSIFLRYVRAAVAVTISWYLETGHTNAPRGSIERAAASIR